MIEEIWKSIINYEELYEVSNYGRVKSLPRKWRLKEKILKSSQGFGGYLYVNLCKNKKQTLWRIHKLVLEAFLGPCSFGMEVCHNDGNPENNFVGNLRYDTRKNNIKDTMKHGRTTTGVKNRHAKLNNKKIIEIRESKLSYGELATRYSVSESNICLIKNKKRWKHIEE